MASARDITFKVEKSVRPAIAAWAMLAFSASSLSFAAFALGLYVEANRELTAYRFRALVCEATHRDRS